MRHGNCTHPTHREELPVRTCPCGTILATGNPNRVCARCNRGAWVHPPNAVTAVAMAGQMANGRNGDRIRGAAADLMEEVGAIG